MNITQLDLDKKSQVEDFLRLPFSIYRDIPQWVPPLQMDERLRLRPKRFPYYKHSHAAFFLACSGVQPIGRLAVLDNRPYNEFNREATAFFYLFECENNPEAAQGMFEAGFAWARSRGLTRIIGPKGFTPLDGFGLLVKGFEHRPAFGLPYNPAYYVDLIEAQGFEKHGEAVSGYIGTDVQFPERIHELAERIKQRRGLRIARYEKRSDLRALVPKLRDLYNGALRGTAGNVPISDEEADALANQMLWFADPKLIKIVMKGSDPVGFLLAYPDVSAALQKTKGRLFPFGWLALLRELKRTGWLNINGAGLLPEYRGSGGMAVLYSEMFKSVRESGQFRHAEVIQIGVENEAMRRDMENFGMDFYKVHRTYSREIAC
ncbi:MAG: hypothetical protein DPW18_13990 [Chloroflexi bacterium]|nr:hypothetical protein [Chloroflexota bacterium]MDL1942919.1 hypothetical protein [Chloroflexi bacterium CFX2]